MYSTWINSTMALYMPWTASAPITSGLVASVSSSALVVGNRNRNGNGNGRKRQKRDASREATTRICMCIGFFVSSKRRVRKMEKQLTFESRRYRLLASKTSSYLFQAFLCRLCLWSMARERLPLGDRAASSPNMVINI